MELNLVTCTLFKMIMVSGKRFTCRFDVAPTTFQVTK